MAAAATLNALLTKVTLRRWMADKANFDFDSMTGGRQALGQSIQVPAGKALYSFECMEDDASSPIILSSAMAITILAFDVRPEPFFVLFCWLLLVGDCRLLPRTWRSRTARTA